MKPRSIAGVVYAARDLDRTTAFYQAIGFRPGTQVGEVMTMYVNWFWVEFHHHPDMEPVTDTGSKLYVSIENVDEAYQELQALKFATEGEPVTTPQRRRELTVIDPDGHRLVLFQKP